MLNLITNVSVFYCKTLQPPPAYTNLFQSWDFKNLFLEYSRYDVESPLKVTFPPQIFKSTSKIQTVIAGKVFEENFEVIAFDTKKNEVFHILIDIEQRKLSFWGFKDGRVIPEDGKLEMETDIDAKEEFVIRRIKLI